MISIQGRTEGSLIIEARGQLTHKDYEDLVPQLEREMAQHGKLRLLIRLKNFEGWSPEGLVDELRFDIRHHDDFERVAIVGENRWEKIATQVSAPFFSGSMRYFEDEDEARAWLG